MTVERAKKLIDAMITGMINEEGMHVLPVIRSLIDYGFTKDELINDFYFTEEDVDTILEEEEEEE